MHPEGKPKEPEGSGHIVEEETTTTSSKPSVEDGEPIIREVEDARAGLRQIHKAKDPDAVWVPGLEPESAARHPSREELMEELARRRAAEAASGRWMQTPYLLGILALVSLAVQLYFFDSFLATLSFPEQEWDAWPIIKELDMQQLAIYHGAPLIQASFAAAMAIQLGVAGDSFGCFIGVGIASLVYVASMGDALLIYRACPDISPDAECDLPCVMHWICCFVKSLCPALAAFATSSVWDMLWIAKKTGNAPQGLARRLHRWGIALLVPSLLPLLHMIYAGYFGAPNHTIFQLSLVVQLVVWIVLIMMKVRVQPRFAIRAVDPSKKQS